MTPKTPVLQPKQIVRKYVKAITHGTAADLAKWAAADIKATQGSQKAQGLAALEHYAMTYRKQLPGWNIQMERLIGEGNWVAAAGCSEWKAGRDIVRVPFVAQYRVSRGKVAEVVIAVDGSVADPGSNSPRSNFPLEPNAGPPSR